MRWVIVILVAVVLAFVGYTYLSQEDGDQLAEQAGQAVQDAVESTQEAVDQATDAASDAADAAGDAADAASDQLTEAGTAVQEQLASLGSAAEGLKVEGTDLGTSFAGVIDEVSTSLSGITDQATAENAKAALEAVATKVESAGALIEQLPDDAKKTFDGLVTSALPSVEAMADKAYSIEGVGDVLKPVLDPMIETMKGWSDGGA